MFTGAEVHCTLICHLLLCCWEVCLPVGMAQHVTSATLCAPTSKHTFGLFCAAIDMTRALCYYTLYFGHWLHMHAVHMSWLHVAVRSICCNVEFCAFVGGNEHCGERLKTPWRPQQISRGCLEKPSSCRQLLQLRTLPCSAC